MGLSVRIMARAIIWGGNPMARVVNRTSHIIGRVATTIAPHRYALGKTRQEISDILQNQELETSSGHRIKLALRWYWHMHYKDPRTSIVFTEEYYEGSRFRALYMGRAGRFMDKFQPAHLLPQRIKDKLSFLSITGDQKAAIRNILRRAIETGWHKSNLNRLYDLLVLLMISRNHMESCVTGYPENTRFISHMDRIIRIGSEACKKGHDRRAVDRLCEDLDSLIVQMPEDTLIDEKRFDAVVDTMTKFAENYLHNVMVFSSALSSSMLGIFIEKLPKHISSDNERFKCVMDICERHINKMPGIGIANDYLMTFGALLNKLPEEALSDIKSLEAYGSVLERMLDKSVEMRLSIDATCRLFSAFRRLIEKLPSSSLADPKSLEDYASFLLEMGRTNDKPENIFTIAGRLIHTMPANLAVDTRKFKDFIGIGCKTFRKWDKNFFNGLFYALGRVLNKLDANYPDYIKPLNEYGEILAEAGNKAETMHPGVREMYIAMGDLIDVLPKEAVTDKELLRKLLTPGVKAAEENSTELAAKLYRLERNSIFELPEELRGDKETLRKIADIWDQLLDDYNYTSGMYYVDIDQFYNFFASLIRILSRHPGGLENLDKYKCLVLDPDDALPPNGKRKRKGLIFLSASWNTLVNRLPADRVKDIEILKAYREPLINAMEKIHKANEQYSRNNDLWRLFDTFTPEAIMSMPEEYILDIGKFTRYLEMISDAEVDMIRIRSWNIGEIGIGSAEIVQLSSPIDRSLNILPDHVKTNTGALKWFLNILATLEKGSPEYPFIGEIMICLASIMKNLPQEQLADAEKLNSYRTFIANLILTIDKYKSEDLGPKSFLPLLAKFMEAMPQEAFSGDGLPGFINCSTTKEYEAFVDILICNSVLAEKFKCPVYFEANELNHFALRARLVNALKRVNLTGENLVFVGDIPDSFLREANIAEKVTALAGEIIPNLPKDLVSSNEAALVISLAKLAAHWPRIREEDANIRYLLDILNAHAGLADYYRKAKAGILREMEIAGFDVNYLLSGDEVLSRDLSNEAINDQSVHWKDNLRKLMRRIVGTRESKPEKIFAFNRKPTALLHKLHHVEFKKALEGDKDAAKGIIEVLLKIIESQLKTSHDRLLEDWHDTLSGISGAIEYEGRNVSVRGMRALRSRKLFPEILFDNKRLGCCIFWPHGTARHEIARLLLDPKTPLLEIWLEGSNEFMGIVPQYVGRNSAGRLVLFVDTVEYSHSIYKAVGRNYSLKFMLDALVLDAHRMGAKEMAVYKRPYGTSAEFVSFIGDIAPRSDGVIKDVPAYYFKAVDAGDAALSDSESGKHHYTDAYGDPGPLVGKKECFVIDVESYIEKVLKGKI